MNNNTSYTEFPDIPYVQPQDNTRLLDMYIPDTGRPCPVLIFFHGGGLEGGGRKDQCDIFRCLAGSGIAVVSADYRLYPNAVFPDYIEDAAMAAAFTIKYGKERGLFSDIYIGGSSAGAYLSMHLCFNLRWLSGTGIKNHEIKGYIFDAGQPTVHFNVLRERGMDQRRICIDEAAPIYYLDENFINSGIQSGMLFITADNDMPCRYEQNMMMVKNLEHFGYNMSKVAFRLMKGYSHTAYISAQNPNGGLIYADLIEQFIRNGAEGLMDK